MEKEQKRDLKEHVVKQPHGKEPTILRGDRSVSSSDAYSSLLASFKSNKLIVPLDTKE
ncbi:hypothetical protein [Bacillus sp. ISL-7]|uniref:hypothetical protein n=1 Tax=Bacillus sp. ISL-7 TaxID=2819136 RepID=UPI001BE7F349|nr:hypothetical protein [Bacillus sp. ISL-7]MBT2734725.1 hypothetical protein [Bacillus sp. ISL-7]